MVDSRFCIDTLHRGHIVRRDVSLFGRRDPVEGFGKPPVPSAFVQSLQRVPGAEAQVLLGPYWTAGQYTRGTSPPVQSPPLRGRWPALLLRAAAPRCGEALASAGDALRLGRRGAGGARAVCRRPAIVTGGLGLVPPPRQLGGSRRPRGGSPLASPAEYEGVPTTSHSSGPTYPSPEEEFPRSSCYSSTVSHPHTHTSK
ncbi:hypothetical protein F7725_013625 [Dissostichus mawsoni]|uniref:Uncharacterized protein n=1 Tax=Dissostichus mawsoni TaxID=36200 RepID=A0A7J5Y4E3_DISMA|nr:hypothetical protein F7725_013625 [Dissostichus mawsoni]